MRRLMMVHAHPDDESITTGGTLARYSAAGARTVLVTCTRGEVGEIADPALATRETLGEVRSGELAEATRILGVSRAVQLGYRDSGMVGTEPNQHPAAFLQADFEEATRRVVAVIREERPHVLVTYDERGGYGHPDHIRAHQVAVAAFHAAGDPARHPEAGEAWAPRKLYYVVFPRSQVMEWAEAFHAAGVEAPFSAVSGADAGQQAPPEFGTPDDLVTTCLDVAAHVDQKWAALLAHRTQVGTYDFFFRIPEDAARRLWSAEYYRLAIGPTPARVDGWERDLFSGVADDD